uniref:Uncharacterized protein n=1 Tax=Ascaris lumbricoides TaxID=6252 RepID=A0A0M3HPD2_ASCLU
MLSKRLDVPYSGWRTKPGKHSRVDRSRAHREPHKNAQHALQASNQRGTADCLKKLSERNAHCGGWSTIKRRRLLARMPSTISFAACVALSSARQRRALASNPQSTNQLAQPTNLTVPPAVFSVASSYTSVIPTAMPPPPRKCR